MLPILLTDLKDRINQLKSEDSWHKNDRNAITLFKTENCSVVLSRLHKGSLSKYNNTFQ